MNTGHTMLLALGLLLGSASFAGTLSNGEIYDLRYMREEEKLAHDVYLTFQRKYRERVFATIRQSEERHMDAIKGLLDRYGLDDPVQPGVGVFQNPALQALYNELVAQGLKNRVAALRVGALIEETDIRDIALAIERSDEAVIDKVYSNLLAGSSNHLVAFVRRLQALGVTYVPSVLVQSDYDAIIGN